MPTLNGITYEMVKGPNISFENENGWSAKATYKLLWDDAVDFVEATFAVPISIGGYRQWVLPGSLDNFTFLNAKSADIAPFDDDFPGGCAEPPSSLSCLITISYEASKIDSPEEEQGEDGQVGPTTFEHSVDIGGEFLTMPSRGWHWNSDGEQVKDEDIPMGKIIPTAEHNLHWPQVDNPPWDAIRNVIGGVNQVAIFGCAAETLLMLGAQLKRTVTAQQAKAWDVNYKLSERLAKADNGTRITWNHFWRPDEKKWDILEIAGAGDRVYARVDLTTIFQF